MINQELETEEHVTERLVQLLKERPEHKAMILVSRMEEAQNVATQLCNGRHDLYAQAYTVWYMLISPALKTTTKQLSSTLTTEQARSKRDRCIPPKPRGPSSGCVWPPPRR